MNGRCFRITGVDDSGREVSIEFKADDERGALAFAKSKGIFATHAEEIPLVSNAKASQSRLPNAGVGWSGPRRVAGSSWAIGGAVLLVLVIWAATRPRRQLPAESVTATDRIAPASAKYSRANEEDISDPQTRDLFRRARQDYLSHGWNANLLDSTISAQVRFQGDASVPNLVHVDELLVRFELEWKENRRNAGLAPEDLSQ